MVKTISIVQELKTMMKEEKITQKYVAIDANIPLSTLKGHVNGGLINADTVVNYSSAVDNSKFTMDVAFKLLGTVKGMDGEIFKIESPNDLDILQIKESKERKSRREEVQFILAQRSKNLSNQEKETLLVYVNEFLDEIVVEISRVISILNLVGLPIMKVFKERIPHWKEFKYMKD